jgi:hypothetical protein
MRRPAEYDLADVGAVQKAVGISGNLTRIYKPGVGNKKSNDLAIDFGEPRYLGQMRVNHCLQFGFASGIERPGHGRLSLGRGR